MRAEDVLQRRVSVRGGEEGGALGLVEDCGRSKRHNTRDKDGHGE